MVNNAEAPKKKDFLGLRPVPDLRQAQLDLVTKDTIRAGAPIPFNPVATLDALQRREGEHVYGMDIGGNKAQATLFRVHNGTLEIEDTEEHKSTGGAGYRDFLAGYSRVAANNTIPVGVSFAGPIDGTRVVNGPNVKTFLADMQRAHSRMDFSDLFPTLRSAENDAVTGMVASVVEVKRKLPQVGKVQYIINGSGLGAALFQDGNIIPTEAGHAPVDSTLNVFGQDRISDFGNFIDIEAVAAGKAGGDAIWQKLTGEKLDGESISALLLSGNARASQLYDSSALLTAHVIVGLANLHQMLQTPEDTAIVGHILDFHLSSSVLLMYARSSPWGDNNSVAKN